MHLEFVRNCVDDCFDPQGKCNQNIFIHFFYLLKTFEKSTEFVWNWKLSHINNILQNMYKAPIKKTYEYVNLNNIIHQRLNETNNKLIAKYFISINFQCNLQIISCAKIV